MEKTQRGISNEVLLHCKNYLSENSSFLLILWLKMTIKTRKGYIDQKVAGMNL